MKPLPMTVKRQDCEISLDSVGAARYMHLVTMVGEDAVSVSTRVPLDVFKMDRSRKEVYLKEAIRKCKAKMLAEHGIIATAAQNLGSEVEPQVPEMS